MLQKCIMEKTHFEVLLYLYINNASITQKMRFLYIEIEIIVRIKLFRNMSYHVWKV